MLAVSSYKPDFLASQRQRIARQLEAYDRLVASADISTAAAFAPEFFSNMVLALDHYFMHRLRMNEGKDGNPLNEVRMLAVSLLEHDGIMTRDNTIRYDPSKSVTGIPLGQPISIDRETFEVLAEAFMRQIEAKYP